MAKFLPAAIESVLAQDYPRIEYIVMDEGSADGPIGVLEGYRGRLQYFSEKDRCPADAIEKGFSKASGDVLAWPGRSLCLRYIYGSGVPHEPRATANRR